MIAAAIVMFLSRGCNTLQPLYNTVRYNSFGYNTDGSQKCIDYIELLGDILQPPHRHLMTVAVITKYSETFGNACTEQTIGITPKPKLYLCGRCVLTRSTTY